MSATDTPHHTDNTSALQYFSEQDVRTLTLICDTLIPAIEAEHDPYGYYARSASDLNIAPQIARIIEQVVEQPLVMQLKLFLHSLENPLANTFLSGQARPFSAMSQQERIAVLSLWANSRLNLRRKAFQSVKRLAMFYYYGIVDENRRNPNWDAIDYSGPPPTRITEPDTQIQPLHINEDTILTTDVVIVGSGAGGGVVAGELSAAGYDVVVLEKGDYYSETDFDGIELESVGRMYENRGLVTTDDLNMILLAGNTLGGSTTINWAASFRTPDNVLREWETRYGLTGFTGKDYQDAMDAVSARINVNTDCPPNQLNSTLVDGAEQLGLEYDVIPRNTVGCQDCGFCNYGCQYGAKQSTLRTYLQDTFDRGGRIVVRATVRCVLVERGRAIGVAATIVDSNGQTHHLTVRAQRVVVAAGALHTPLLLMRSGLTNANIGDNLHLHPTTSTYGIFDDPIRGWEGAPLSRHIKAFKDLDGRGYGITLETAPVHPGIGAMAMPWSNGYQHKEIMSRLANLSNIIIIARDRGHGRVSMSRRGHLKVQYSLSPYDATHLMRGILESMRVHQAAGAYQIGAPYTSRLVWHRDEDFESFLRTASQSQLLPNTFALFSAHQMSSCRMASNPALGALKPTGETYEVHGLYVADASVVPTATGVNPMLSIMSVAHIIAGNIKADLN